MSNSHISTESPFSAPRDDLATSPSETRTMTRRHFTLQDERPTHVVEVDLMEMDPSLRSLLFTDGTVTRTLEVQTLSRVSVEVLAQMKSQAVGPVATYLEVPDGAESMRRRVVIGTRASTTPVIWAESHILPSRLPQGFLGVLDDASDGIGESLQQVKLESWREILWFGLDLPPEWSGVNPQTEPSVIRRLYRVIANHRPALLISESFAVEQRGGTYHLDCSG